MRYAPQTVTSNFATLTRRVAALEREKTTASVGADETYVDAVLARSDLWAYWPLNDASGDAIDLVSGRVMGVSTSGTGSFSYGQPGPFPNDPSATSMLFTPGTGAAGLQHSITGSNPHTASPGAFTWTLWVYPTTTSGVDSLMSMVPTASIQTLLMKYTGDRLYVEKYNSGFRDTGVVFSPLSEWRMIALTYAGTTLQTTNVYYDGELVHTFTNGTAAVWNLLRLGVQGDAGVLGNPFRGRMAQVAVFTTALTAAEISGLYEAGAPLTAGYDQRVVNVGGAYTAQSADDVILANGTFTVTLPTAVGNAGREITVKNTGAGTITVGRTGSETIDGAASNVTISTSMRTREFTSAGVGWHITAAYS